MTTAQRSNLFTVFNAARRIPGFDRSRLNRALGLAQRNEYEPEYRTSSESCDCPDAKYRGSKTGPCKHQLAAILLEVAA